MILRTIGILTLVTIAAMLVAGCGGSSATGPGTAIIGPAGGRLEAGGLIVDFPPGALPADFTILVTPLSPGQVPAPPDGLAVISAARFEPAGLQFLLPVTITFPLSARLPAGQTLTLYELQNNTWQDSGFNAVVSADRRTAAAEVSHFSIYAIFGDYAPLAVGASWTYHWILQTTPAGGAPNPPESGTVTATITGTEEVGGLTTFVWSESAPSNVTLWLHRTDAAPYELLLAAVQMASEAQEVLDPPARLLSLPPIAGQTWEVASVMDVTATATVSAETITVGSVEYDTMKVHIAPPDLALGYLDIWYAPNVGIVKRKAAEVDPGVSTTVIEMDLQSYSLP